MATRRRLTDLQVQKLPVRDITKAYPDPELINHYIRVTPNGARSYYVKARDPSGKQIPHTLGPVSQFGIDQARDRARLIIRRIKDGLPPKDLPPEQPDSYEQVARNWLQRDIAKRNLITEREIGRVLDKYILPEFGQRSFVSIGRKDISKFMDRLEDRHGPRMADVCLSQMKAIADFYAKRDDDYVSPFVRKMRRSTAKPRDRILTDDEIRTMWKQTGQVSTWGAFLRMLLLVAQRSEKVRTMRWSDLHDENGALVWHIPSVARGKGTAGRLRLPKLAVDIIAQQPHVHENDYVFAGSRSNGPFAIGKTQRGFGNPKNGGWTFHDLRRTARSLLTRLRIDRDVAEAVLGHQLKGIESVYNRHDFFEEKGRALGMLSALIEDIIDGTPTDKVIPIRRSV